MSTSKIWFTTDLHGSNECFKKLLILGSQRKELEAILIGGDLTGKYLLPIIQRNGTWLSSYDGKQVEFAYRSELDDFIRQMSDRGMYTIECDPDEWQEISSNQEWLDKIALRQQCNRIRLWGEWAKAHMAGSDYPKILISCGNDDPFELDDTLATTEPFEFVGDETFTLLSGNEIVSFAYSPPTPWNTPREAEEVELSKLINSKVSSIRKPESSIFNFHCPPIETSLDLAPKIDRSLRLVGRIGIEKQIHVGSSAVLQSVKWFSPLVGLHGHVHEQHCHQKIGKTICCNPGSEYFNGYLRGVFLAIDETKVVHLELTKE